MGANLFDVLLTPAFAIGCVLALAAAAAVLISSKKRGVSLPMGRRTFLITVIVLAAAYFLFVLALVFLFDSAPPIPPVPQ